MTAAPSLKPLNQAERARAEAMREAVLRYIPEIVPFIRTLQQEGMLARWRSMTHVELLR